jgi:Skp family chaperone for outer membrane proteins
MSKSFWLSMILAVAALGLTAPLSAQTRSAVSVAELDAAVAERPAAVREAVQEFLTTERGQEAADRIGMSASELSARVADLDEASLNRIAEQAGISDEVLAGGADTIVITATTAIIILLLVILLVK